MDVIITLVLIVGTYPFANMGPPKLIYSMIPIAWSLIQLSPHQSSEIQAQKLNHCSTQSLPIVSQTIQSFH